MKSPNLREMKAEVIIYNSLTLEIMKFRHQKFKIFLRKKIVLMILSKICVSLQITLFLLLYKAQNGVRDTGALY